MPGACAAVAIAVQVRPRIAYPAAVRTLDLSLLAIAVAIAAQLVPLPAGIWSRLDPHAAGLREALWLAPVPAGALPVSVDPKATIEALAIYASAVLLFWACRRACELGGAGRIVRGTAVIGLLASMAAIVLRPAQLPLAVRHLVAAGSGRPPVRTVREPESLRDLAPDGHSARFRIPARARAAAARGTAGGATASSP